MGFDHRRTVTFRLAQAAHVYRVRAGSRLSRIELHSGQENLLKALETKDGQSMSDLASALGVQPPTVTKMISRLAAQDYVERRAAKGDGRQAMVFLTERGQKAISSIDKVWKRIEKDALAGIDDKDRKRLRKLLRQVERNLGAAANGDDTELEDKAGGDA
ncbi:MarR family winged helix-turn-helix transcriptional regulator [Bauldia litoralis]|uniref:MarR family winged helix-turn-helix transcriptional regulator n=1 Tax=Bauldia litoralis TaxID=665467 RepID=UPI003263B084